MGLVFGSFCREMDHDNYVPFFPLAVFVLLSVNGPHASRLRGNGTLNSRCHQVTAKDQGLCILIRLH